MICWSKLFAEEFRQQGGLDSCMPKWFQAKVFFTWKSLSFGLGGHTTHSASPLTWRWKEANHAFQSRYLSRSWFGISCKYVVQGRPHLVYPTLHVKGKITIYFKIQLSTFYTIQKYIWFSLAACIQWLMKLYIPKINLGTYFLYVNLVRMQNRSSITQSTVRYYSDDAWA